MQNYTRFRVNQQPSVLDLIMSNEEDMVVDLEFLSPLGASDHKVLTFQFNCYCSYTKILVHTLIIIKATMSQ